MSTPNTDAASLTARSLAHVWHPCTQMKDHEGPLPLLPVKSAEGVWLQGHDGRRYLDIISSWWTNIFGHRHPWIVRRLKEQLDTLDHVIFAGFTHEPAVKLAEALCAIAPPGLNRVFYADNGSAAVEVALKMSAHYWRNTGRPGKTKFIALDNGYHGETLGALAVGGTGLYRDAYTPLMMEPIFVPSPDCYARAPGESWEDHTRRQFRYMQETLARHAHEVAAVIVEPLVQCAGGMRMYHPVYLSLLREACSRCDVHLIVDEIATGFGRTGKLFASDWAFGTPQADAAKLPGTAAGPDFMCVSKGITAGTLPLAAVLTTDTVYEAFYDDYAARKAFLHSHSYTGNPLACAAGLATMEVFAQQDWMARNRQTAAQLWAGTAELRAHRNVAEVRQQGMILAIEMVKNARTREAFAAADRRGLRAYRHALNARPDCGVVLRPLGDVLYFMPPYVIEPEEVDFACQVALEAVHAATQD